jgi:hypothetical protein
MASGERPAKIAIPFKELRASVACGCAICLPQPC